MEKLLTKSGLSKTIELLKQFVDKEIQDKNLSKKYADLLNKADIIKTDGDGTSFLNINGEYTPIDLSKIEETQQKIQNIFDVFNIEVQKEEWEIKSPMPTNRRSMATATVNNKIYCICGTDTTGATDLNEVYNCDTDTWETKTNSPEKRSDLSAAVYNNKIYCICGSGKDGSSTSTNYNKCYNISTDSWETKSNSLVSGIYLSTKNYNDNIFLLGGGYSNCKYNCITDSWSYVTSMPNGRNGMGVSMYNSSIFCMGGYNKNKSSYDDCNEVYDCKTDSWTTKAKMISPRYLLSSSNIDECIYCVGGFDGHDRLNTNEMYNSITDTWETKLESLESKNCISLETYNKKLYSFGGNLISGNSNIVYSPENITYQLDLSNDPNLSKTDILSTSGDGNKYLADNGQYISIEPKINPMSESSIQSIIDTL